MFTSTANRRAVRRYSAKSARITPAGRRAVGRAAAASRVACESLEHRLMFITTTLDGTSGADVIAISVDGSGIHGTVNGVTDDRSDTIFNTIEVNGLGGADTININSTGANAIVVNAGAGNDSVRITPSSGNMSNIDESVTVNGEGDTDTVTLFDTNSGGVSYLFFSAFAVQRTGGDNIGFHTVESLVINASNTAGDGAFVNLVPSADVTFNAGSGTGDTMRVAGTGAESADVQPTSATGGVVNYEGSAITFAGVDSITTDDLAQVSLVTPNGSDTVNVVRAAAGRLDVNSVSGASTLPDLTVENVTGFTVDLAAHDTASSVDSLVVSGPASGSHVVKLNAGGGASNTLGVGSGTWTIDTDLGLNGGNNLDVDLNSSGNVTFSGSQSLHGLQIGGNATARFTGTGTVLTVQELVIVAGTGTIDLASGQTATCPSGGLFSIHDGHTLVKKGLGTLSISATQSHEPGGVLDARGGATNLNTDAGSAASRVLTVQATAATVNLLSTQHLAAVSSGIGGTINLGTNGNRVLVTGSIGVESEGGQLNLNDNDMIFDYAPGAVAADAAVRDLLHSGRANGNWNGLGIASNSASANPLKNTTLGFMEATEYALVTNGSTTFDGQSLDASALVVKYTYYGDSNFSGRVTFDDYVRTDIGFNTHLTGWINGDFNDSGNVNFDDYVLIDSAFNNQGATLGRSRVTRELAKTS